MDREDTSRGPEKGRGFFVFKSRDSPESAAFSVLLRSFAEGWLRRGMDNTLKRALTSLQERINKWEQLVRILF
jgi:hypothetical protein